MYFDTVTWHMLSAVPDWHDNYCLFGLKTEKDQHCTWTSFWSQPYLDLGYCNFTFMNLREIFLEIFIVSICNIFIGLYNIESQEISLAAILEDGAISHGSICKMIHSRL